MAHSELQTLIRANAPSGIDPAPVGKFVGRILSHYHLEERVGVGGMGEVYRAHDRALGRPAAVKVLPDDFTPALRERLLREAWASARLQHPAIATFFEAGEDGGLAFIAMEFVSGQTLRTILANDRLSSDRALAITGCLLEGLGHAHTAGVLHRDIKPENVIVTGDRSAKLLDFGLAKLLHGNPPELRLSSSRQPEGPLPCGDQTGEYQPELDATRQRDAAATDLTSPGSLLGTIGYMAPEQVRGDAVDHRTDLFLVGSVLYEMLTGRRAFPGKSAQERFDAILGTPPPGLDSPDFPTGVGDILARAMAFDPADRYPSATAFLADLRKVGETVAAASLPDTVVVLDFINLSGELTDDWLGHGMAEGVAAQLAGVPHLRLVPRPKVIQARAAFAGPEPEFGLWMGCRWVVAGTVTLSGQTLHATIRLIDVPTSQDVVDAAVTTTTADLLEAQRRLGAAVTARFTPNPGCDLGPADADLFEWVTRGRRLMYRFHKEAQDQAQEFFERAVSRDPDHAPALSGLAMVHALRYPYSTDRRDLEIAVVYARRAIASDPELSDPHVWLGYALFGLDEGNLEAFKEYVRAVDLASTNFMALHFQAGYCLWCCDPARARRLYETITGHAAPADFNASKWRREEAIRIAQRAVTVNPLLSGPWISLGVAHLDLGNVAEARWCLERVVAIDRQGGGGKMEGGAGFLGECLRRIGDLVGARAHALAGLEVAEKSDHIYRDTQRGIFLCSLGRTALQQGDVETARAAFRRAVQHLRGRSRARAAGHVLVQALAGLTRAGSGHEPFEEAIDLYRNRNSHDFSFLWYCTDDVTTLELARAAQVLGRQQEAIRLFETARDWGATEASPEGLR